MSLASGIAVFFITWWVCLFMVRPWGARSHYEEGVEVQPGTEAGAPVRHMLPRKLFESLAYRSARIARTSFKRA